MDAWTSKEGTNYLAVVAHFLDERHKLQTALLDLPPLKGPHSGENIAKVLSTVIDFYDVSPIIGFFMMDNATSNDVCIQELAEQYPTIRRENRLRCVGHMLNLIVKALLFGQGVSKLEKQLGAASDDERFEIWRKQNCIGKLHNFCVWINRSDQRRERLKQYILRAYDEGSIEHLYTRVLVDGGISWNSVYSMIERALKLRHAIDLFFLNYRHVGAEGYDISQDILTPQDWADLDHFLNILKPFKDLAKRMEGRANKAGSEGSHGSLHETLESLDVLFKKLQEAGKFADDHPDVVSTYYSHAIDAARIKLEEYFGLTDATPAHRCAVALHPANKFTYFELEWSHNKQWIGGAKRVVQEVFAQYEAAAAEVDLMDGARQEEELEELEEEAIADNSVTLDPLQQARKRRQRLAVTAMSATRGKKRAKLTSELDEFMARTNKADLDVEDPLEWWVRHASDYPILSKMAFDLFSCPAMSAECERVFSQTKTVITDERNRLSSDTVAAIECQKHLLRSGMLAPETPHRRPGRHLSRDSSEGQDLGLFNAKKRGTVASDAIQTATPISSSPSAPDSATSARTSQPLILAPLETVEAPDNGGDVLLSVIPSRCSSISRTRDAFPERQLSLGTPQGHGLETNCCGTSDAEAKAFEGTSGSSPGTRMTSSPSLGLVTRHCPRRKAAHRLIPYDNDGDSDADSASQGSEEDIDHPNLLRDEDYHPSLAADKRGQDGEISDEDEQCPRKRRKVSRPSTSLMRHEATRAERSRRGRASL
ncbi:hypothetical protein MRS44_013366 [Fusarium solani]|uniref:uncharacterized protein n=1 Tax=Fusarium solani TaxID=169388 RepID=UPI0032C45103|nr:hypothetical protein MRS44_013366 [Fusarium solani]